jgi:hypothetical protein
VGLGVRDRDQVFGLRCAADAERAAEPISIPVNTDFKLRSPHTCGNSLGGGLGSPTMGGLSKLSLLLGVLWSRSLVQGLAGGGHCLSVDSSLSEKVEVQC